MAKKNLKIGILYQFFSAWTGGQYYLNNLIQALLEYKPQHRLVILSLQTKEVRKYFPHKNIHVKNPYPVKLNYLQAAINKLSGWVLRKKLIDKYINDTDIDVLYPATNEAAFSKLSNKIYWFADFQHIYYPNFFEPGELQRRKELLETINNPENSLILSSQSARHDFLKLYPNPVCRVFVLPFAVSLPPTDHIEPSSILKKYGLQQAFYVVSNQFWKHKNHSVVLRALQLLKEQNSPLNFQVVFTGKADSDYAQQIKSQIIALKLKNEVVFAGFIPRAHQIVLIQQAIAVIQPSFFEGWSTIVEDTKALNQFIVLSDLPVHKEQITQNADFFVPDNPQQLAAILQKYSLKKPTITKQNYQDKIKQFATDFENIVYQTL